MKKLIAIIPAAFIAFAIYTAILILFCGEAQGQTTYQLNYDSIRVNKTAGTGGTSLYGKVYLKNVSLGVGSDSILVVRNGRIFKVVKTNGTVNSVSGTSPISVATGTTTPVISIAAANTSTTGALTNTDWNTFNNKAPIASPTFTGVPAAPTATAGTNTTQLASTAFVTNGIATSGALYLPLVGGASKPLTGSLFSSFPAVFTQNTQGTNPAYGSFQNTGGVAYIGLEGATGGALFTGALPYANVYGSTGAYPIHLATSGIVRATITSSGSLAVGATTATGGYIADIIGNLRVSGIIAGNGTVSIYGDASSSVNAVSVETSGKLVTTALKVTTGANTGYVLTSNASGDATWASLASGLTYKGAWNASTNTPTLADGSGTTGWMYAVSVGGTQFGRTFVAGGFSIYNGSIWEPIGTSAAVTSVNALTGTVQINPSLSGNTLSVTGGTATVDISAATGVANKMPLAGGAFSGAVTGTTMTMSGSFNTIKDGSNTAGSGPYYGWNNLASTNAWVRQLNASNGIDDQYYNGSVWAVRQTLNTSGDLNVVGTVTSPTFIGALTGNAATATALQTARTISGASFNGTANIVLNNTGITNGMGYATLASPALTGSPTAPTQTAGDNSTKIATTSYVDTKFASTSNRQLKDWYADANNVSTTETDLMTYTVPANTLVNNGDKMSFRFSGIYGGTANSKSLKIYFGLLVVNLGTSTLSGGSWIVNGTIIKTGATTFRINISETRDTPSQAYSYTSGTVSNYTGTNIFKITGTGGESSDVTAQIGELEFKPAAL